MQSTSDLSGNFAFAMRDTTDIPEGIRDGLLWHSTGPGAEAFSTLRTGVLPYPVLQPHQVHGDRVVVVRDRSLTRDDLQGVDALVTNLDDFAVSVRTADCIPVLLYDAVHRAVGAAHAGWRGTAADIAGKTIRVMAATYGTVPSDLRAVIGPGIGPDSFQIGPEVAEAFGRAGFPMQELLTDEGPRVAGTMHGGLHFDLWRANRWLLMRAGVPSAQIQCTGIDTYQRNDLFFSARREGLSCGRIINSVRLLP